MSRTAQIIIAAVVVIGLIIVLFATSSNQTVNRPDSNDNAGEENTDVPTDWETYVSDEFSFTIAHPAKVSVQTEGPENRHTKFTYLGSDNEEGTEITDGFTLTVSAFSKTETEETTPEEFANERIKENPIAQVIEPVTSTTFHGRAAVTYQTESIGIGVEHIITETEDSFIQISTGITDPNNAGYSNIVAKMRASLILQSVDQPASVSKVSIALLDSNVPEGAEPERGCDMVEMVSRDIESTPAPLNAALEELFALESENIDGFMNFIARTSDTLSFDRAVVENGTAHIYLAGELSGLRGICDNPRAKIQIEETALQFNTVEAVQLYLNEEKTELQPDGRGE